MNLPCVGLQVYITCTVILCVVNTTGTRCSQGCISHLNNRGRREAVDQTSRHSISQGPLNLVPSSDSKGEWSSFTDEEPEKCWVIVFGKADTHPQISIHTPAGSGLSLSQGLNIAFIVGCLLLCAVVIYRSRRSKTVKYKPLSTFEID